MKCLVCHGTGRREYQPAVPLAAPGGRGVQSATAPDTNRDASRTCKKCGRTFGILCTGPRELCMECLCSVHNKPVGLQQGEPDPPGDGNPRHILNSNMELHGNGGIHRMGSWAERVDAGFRMMDGLPMDSGDSDDGDTQVGEFWEGDV